MVVGLAGIAGAASASATTGATPAGFGRALQSFQRFGEHVLDRSPYIIAALCCVVLTFVVARIVRGGIDASFRRSRREPHLRVLLDKLVFVGIWLVGGIVALALLGVNLAVLVGSLGLLTVALGFALQAVTGSFVAGIVLLLEHPFTLGDYIVSTTAEGTVEEIRVRATRLRAPDGRAVTVPNLLLFANPVTNSSTTSRRRLDVAVTVPPDQDAAPAREALAGFARSRPIGQSGPPARVLTTDLGADGTLVTLQLWLDPRVADLDGLRSEALERAESALRDATRVGNRG